MLSAAKPGDVFCTRNAREAVYLDRQNSHGRWPHRLLVGEQVLFYTDGGHLHSANCPHRLDVLGRSHPAPVEQARILADDHTRENFPLYDGLFAYFPAALCEVARWSKIGNDKHNPGEPLHWARDKSTDHENKILRHLLDARQEDGNGVVEAVALAWRALALCQTILEERGWPEGANARRNATKEVQS